MKPDKTPSSFYRLIDHTADVGISIRGDSQRQLFERAGYALFDLITDPFTQPADGFEKIAVEGLDPPDLLVNFLRELLFFWVGEQKGVAAIAIDAITKTQLSATIGLIDYNLSPFPIRTEIKAVTYHGITARKDSSGWVGKVIFDI